MTDGGNKYPEGNIDFRKMDRILRHRLRNLCAGVKMTIDRIAETTSKTHPQLGSRCDIIKSELDNLQSFTDRMDMLFDVLPEPRKKSLFETVSELRSFFVKNFPLCSLELNGPEANIVFRHGSWLINALQELLLNAGAAAGSNGLVKFAWTDAPCVSFTIGNQGKNIGREIPLSPPQPFNTQQSRHDGIGLAIVFRICKEADSELIIDNSKENSVTVSIKLPKEETANE